MQADLFVLVRRALRDSAWPLPWRVSDRDVRQAYESLLRGVHYSFAGDVWALEDGEVVRLLSHSHEAWQEWFRMGNLAVVGVVTGGAVSGKVASLGVLVPVELWSEWVDIDTVAELPDKFQVMQGDRRSMVRWRLVGHNV